MSICSVTGAKVEQQGMSGLFYWPNRKGENVLQGKNILTGQSTATANRQLWGTPHLMTVTELCNDPPPCKDSAHLTATSCGKEPSGSPCVEVNPHADNLYGHSGSAGAQRLRGSGLSDCIQTRTRLLLAKINVCTGCCSSTE